MAKQVPERNPMSFVTPFANPVDIRNKANNVAYYVGQYLNKTSRIMEYTKLPETITRRALEYQMQTAGFTVLTRVKQENGVGVYSEDGEPYCFIGGLGGPLNEYYMPTKFVVANPFLNFSAELEIDKQCVVIPNDTMYMGLLPLLRRYATLLSETDISLLIADVNSRLVSLVSATDDTTKKAAEMTIKQIEDGKLSIVSDHRTLIDGGLKAQPYGNTSSNIITQEIELKQYYKASLNNELGLNDNYNMKREAINSSEAQMQGDALIPLIKDMYECRKEGFDKARDILGIDIQFNLADPWRSRVEDTPEYDEETLEYDEDSPIVEEVENNVETD